MKGTTIVNLKKRNNADENVRNCQATIFRNGNHNNNHEYLRKCLSSANNHQFIDTLMQLKEILITK
jgi:hypothetical protein